MSLNPVSSLAKEIKKYAIKLQRKFGVSRSQRSDLNETFFGTFADDAEEIIRANDRSAIAAKTFAHIVGVPSLELEVYADEFLRINKSLIAEAILMGYQVNK